MSLLRQTVYLHLNDERGNGKGNFGSAIVRTPWGLAHAVGLPMDCRPCRPRERQKPSWPDPEAPYALAGRLNGR